MRDIHSEVSNIVSSYEKAMATFDGNPCAVCGDPFDHTQSNYFPVWSDKHDNLVCAVCYETETVGEVG